MPAITIDLDPPLTGVQGGLYYIVDGIYFHAIDLPLSVNGVIDASVGVTDPTLVYIVVFPEQTIEGVTYRETESMTFNLLNDVYLYVVLSPTGISGPLNPLLGFCFMMIGFLTIYSVRETRRR